MTLADSIDGSYLTPMELVGLGARFDEAGHRLVFADGSTGRLEDVSRYPPRADVHGFPCFRFRAQP